MSKDMIEDAGRAANEGSAFYLARARESMRLAEVEPLRTRRQVYIAAAGRWLRLAETARRVEAGAMSRECGNLSHRAVADQPRNQAQRSAFHH